MIDTLIGSGYYLNSMLADNFKSNSRPDVMISSLRYILRNSLCDKATKDVEKPVFISPSLRVNGEKLDDCSS